KKRKQKGEPWWIQYRNHDGRRKTVRGFTDKSLTEQLAARLEDEARLRQTGLVDASQERLAISRQSSIDSHLDEFEDSLADNTSKHVRLTMTRIRRTVSGCGLATLGELSDTEVRKWLRRHCRENELGNRTYNHYVQAISAFGNWCVQTKRLASNPFVGLERLNAEVDVRHQRRALTAKEFGRLVESARSSGESIQCFDGETRARIYTLSYMTGLRRKELASLTSRSFQLDIKLPILTVAAACSKHRRKDILPLHPELVVLLKVWLRDYKPDEPLFPKLAKRRTWLMVKKDLERAGIPYETAEGIADFHAAGRHTHITELLRNGASLPEARELARHSDIKMTMKYTHIGIEDQARALAGLPVPEPAARAESPQESALQMRCISGDFDRHSTSSDGTEPDLVKRHNPDQGKGYVKDWHQLSPAGKMEAAGIEPASCEP
ncbi:MAG: site-specific integrase, partial [Planctomycetaceae bacterium]|nr:site-specific integrase [Planctomycetaceae bacterium]